MIDRFEANAEIIVGKGRKPRDNVREYDTRSAMENSGLVSPSTIMAYLTRLRGLIDQISMGSLLEVEADRL